MYCCFACLKETLKKTKESKEIYGKNNTKKTAKTVFSCRILSVRLLFGETEERSEIWALIGAWVRNTSSDLELKWGWVDAWWSKRIKGGVVIPRIFPRIF